MPLYAAAIFRCEIGRSSPILSANALQRLKRISTSRRGDLDTPVAESLAAAADSTGQYVIAFTPVLNDALLRGLQISSLKERPVRT